MQAAIDEEGGRRGHAAGQPAVDVALHPCGVDSIAQKAPWAAAASEASAARWRPEWMSRRGKCRKANSSRGAIRCRTRRTIG